MRYVKVFLGIVGAILFSAVGSGVWDLALKSIVLWILDRTATVASLGVGAIRDIPYRDAAQGSPNDGVLFVLSLGVTYMFGRTMGNIDPLQLWTPSESAPPEARALAARRRKHVDRILAFAIFVFLSLQISQIRLTYKLVDDFSHNISALASLIEPREVAAMRVAFTHMKAREDYLKLKATMMQRAKAAGIELPR